MLRENSLHLKNCLYQTEVLKNHLRKLWNQLGSIFATDSIDNDLKEQLTVHKNRQNLD